MRFRCEQDFGRKLESFATFLEQPANKNTEQQSVKLTSENKELLEKFVKFLEMEKAADKCKDHGRHWGKHGRFGKHGHGGMFGHHFGHHHPFGKHSHGFGRHGHEHHRHGHGHHGHHGFEKHHWFWAKCNEASELDKQESRAMETGRNPSPPPQEEVTDPQGVEEQLIQKYFALRRMRHCGHRSRCDKERKEINIAASNEKGEVSTQTESATTANQETSQNLATMVENINITNSPNASE